MRTWWRQIQELLICLREPEPGMVRAGRKEIKERLPAPVSATVSPKVDKATGAAADAGQRFRLQALENNRSRMREPSSNQSEAGPATSPVEILSKPNPVYTDEARSLRLEGEVLLEVMFGANGQLHVIRVVRGMGHGLDEAAVAATNKMRFKPAQHYNEPIDSTATVHVVFQLAY